MKNLLFKVFFLGFILLAALFYFKISSFEMKIVPILIALSNSVGLLLAVFYLGYSLVKFPEFLIK